MILNLLRTAARRLLTPTFLFSTCWKSPTTLLSLMRLRGVVGVLAMWLMLCMSGVAAPAQAQVGPEVTRGLVWLQAQLQSDGSLQSEANSIATPLQSRSEAAQTFQLLATLAPRQLDLIAADTDGNTEYLARQIATLSGAGRDASALLGPLAANRNADGGYGAAPHHASTALDTAFALIALSAAGQTSLAPPSIAYLQAAQQPDGSFNRGRGADLYSSIIVLNAWHRYASQSPVDGNIRLSSAYLMAQQSAPGVWGNSAFSTALAYAALHDFIDAMPTAAAVKAYLSGAQLDDGSWGGDPAVAAGGLAGLGDERDATVRPRPGASERPIHRWSNTPASDWREYRRHEWLARRERHQRCRSYPKREAGRLPIGAGSEPISGTERDVDLAGRASAGHGHVGHDQNRRREHRYLDRYGEG